MSSPPETTSNKPGKTRPLKLHYHLTSELDLHDQDLRGSSLVGSEFYRVNFIAANLAGADLRSCIFRQCAMDRIILDQTRLLGAQFIDCSLQAAQFHQATADEVRVRACKCQNAEFNAAILRNAQFWDCDLTGANFNDASLHGVTTYGCAMAASVLQQHFYGHPQFKGISDATHRTRRAFSLIFSLLAVLLIGLGILKFLNNPTHWKFTEFVDNVERLKNLGNCKKAISLASVGIEQYAYNALKQGRFYYLAGDCYRTQGQLDKALEYAHKAIELAQGEYNLTVPTHYLIFDIFFQQQKYDELLAEMKEFEKNISMPDHRYWYLNSYAIVYLQQKKYDLAQKTYAKMLEEFHDSPTRLQEIRKNVAALELKLGQGDQAMSIVADIMQSSASRPEKLNMLADLIRSQLEANKTQDAESVYAQNKNLIFGVHEINCDRIILGIGDLFRAKSRFEPANQIFDDLLAHGANDEIKALTIRYKSQIYSQMNQPAEAQKLLERSLREYSSVPKEPEEVKTLLAVILRSMGKRQEAMAMFEEIAKITSDPVRANWAYDSISSMFIEDKKFDDAEKFIHINIANAQRRNDKWLTNSSMMNLSNVLVQKGQRDKAIEVLQTITKNAFNAEQKALAMRRVAELQVDMGQIDEALTTYRQIESEFKDQPEFLAEAQFGEALLMRRKNDSDGAFAIYEKIESSKARPDQRARALEGEAHIYLEKNDTAAAEQKYQQVLSSATEPGIQFIGRSGLATVYKASGRKTEAAEQFKKIATENPDRGLQQWAWFELATIQQDLQDVQGAKQTLEIVIKEFAGTPTEAEARKRLESLK